jgi:hypothetical protein
MKNSAKLCGLAVYCLSAAQNRYLIRDFMDWSLKNLSFIGKMGLFQKSGKRTVRTPGFFTFFIGLVDRINVMVYRNT